jgi:hypothetical protein
MNRVPIRFADYLAHVDARPNTSGAACPACGEHEATYTMPAAGNVRDPICEGCLRHFHGHDLAEDTVVRGVIGQAVSGALEAGASADLIRAAVNAALDEDIRREAEFYGRAAVRAA